ncbi:MAG: LysR substrate-binding domain-containing protein [Cognatishimia sp.]|uniref:LysR substrate-binding domain-containing protein n=1 Tax=Cognatishimia sp. TaxID=2211648 RepID=UPI00405920AB
MKSDLIPSTSVLRCFEAAAKHQSYTAAAEELNVTQGAVSRQVRELEALLGVKLFRAAGRGVALTEAGKSFAARLAPDLDRLRQSVNLARAAGEGGKMLSIAVLPTFAARWLAPRLPGFQSQHPEAQMTFHSRSEPFDLISEGIDIAIQFGRGEWSGNQVADLCPEDLAAVAAPSLAARMDPFDPSSIVSLPRLHLLSRRTAWPNYFLEIGAEGQKASQGMMFDQFATMISAAIHGVGAAIVPSFLIEDELASGALAVLGRPQGPTQSYCVATPLGEFNPLAEAFKTWIIAEARRSTRARNTGLSR